MKQGVVAVGNEYAPVAVVEHGLPRPGVPHLRRHDQVVLAERSSQVRPIDERAAVRVNIDSSNTELPDLADDRSRDGRSFVDDGNAWSDRVERAQQALARRARENGSKDAEQ
jgi:hypothetical protein